MSFSKKDTALTREAQFFCCCSLKPCLLLFSTHTSFWSESEILVLRGAPDCVPSSRGFHESACQRCPAQAFFTRFIFTHFLRLFICPFLWENSPEPIGWRNRTVHCIEKAHSAQLFLLICLILSIYFCYCYLFI